MHPRMIGIGQTSTISPFLSLQSLLSFTSFACPSSGVCDEYAATTTAVSAHPQLPETAASCPMLSDLTNLRTRCTLLSVLLLLVAWLHPKPLLLPPSLSLIHQMSVPNVEPQMTRDICHSSPHTVTIPQASSGHVGSCMICIFLACSLLIHQFKPLTYLLPGTARHLTRLYCCFHCVHPSLIRCSGPPTIPFLHLFLCLLLRGICMLVSLCMERTGQHVFVSSLSTRMAC